MNATRLGAAKRIWRRLRHSNWPTRFAILCCLLVFFSVLILVYRRETFVTSNDAQVAGHGVVLGARVEGIVRRVLVDAHQVVREGQLLCELDDRDYRAALDQTAQNLGSAQAELDLARSDFERERLLFKRKRISLQRYDRARARLRSSEKRVSALEASLESARLDLRYTKVVAPSDGVISARSAEPGLWVSKGAPLFAVVEPGNRWVIAKFKETDLSDLRPGAPVEIRIDAIPHQSFAGKVKSFSPATEGTFAAVPPDPAAGNFNKYVQRVPVWIAFDDLRATDLERVRVGLSAEISLRRLQ